MTKKVPREEGIERLKDRPKDDRHPKISGQMEYRIKALLKESNHQDCTTKQVEEMIIQQAEYSTTITTFTVSFVDGALNRRFQGKYM